MVGILPKTLGMGQNGSKWKLGSRHLTWKKHIYLESTASTKTGAGTNGLADLDEFDDNQLSGSRNVQAVGTRFAFVVVVERP